MPKYRVTINEECTYEIEVEADTKEQAGELATQILIDAPQPAVYLTSVDEREVEHIERI
ncbi:hypothetical protein [Burkholderia cenocepacia]|uniref:hypothetical protein n=1 Tax=Burkholderia cenocepacia TaxID=95486 RepID=UPI0026552B7E|nr:hypothetical protein [Burkholderia cenocepacia]MDN7537056.1 hypothetical protein [Burkholderia cenocepacia]